MSMSWIVIILVIAAIIWFVRRNKARQNPSQPQSQIPNQGMPQNRPTGGTATPQRPASTNGRQCPYCAKTVMGQETACPSCGAKLPLPPRPATPEVDPAQGHRPVMGRGQTQQYNGETHVQQGGSGSMLGDMAKTGAAVIATQAILGGLMGQGQAQAGESMPPDPSMMPDGDYPDEGSPFPGIGAGGNNPFGGILGNGQEGGNNPFGGILGNDQEGGNNPFGGILGGGQEDGDSPFGNMMGGNDGDGSPFGNVMGGFDNGTNDDAQLPGGFDNGLSSLSNLGGDDNSGGAGWITDDSDSGGSSWLSSDSDGDSGGSWFSSDDDGPGSSWSFDDDD